MIRTDRNLLLALFILVAPLLLTACTRQDAAAAASAETANAEPPAAQSSKVHEVVITASRLDPHERDEDRDTLPN